MRYATKEMPAQVTCPRTPLPQGDAFHVLHDPEPPVASRLSAERQGGRSLSSCTISGSSTRAHEAELYMALALVGVAAGLGLLGDRSSSC